jgi:hypothetical protein
LPALLAVLATGCGLVVPSQPGTSPSIQATPTQSPRDGPTASAPGSASPGLPAILAGEGRVVWLTDRGGHLGIWTTDLAGDDVRAYVTGLDAAGVALRDARLVGDDVVFIREAPTSAAAELWVVSLQAPPRLLLDSVETFVVRTPDEVLAVRDSRTTRAIWRVPTHGAPPGLLAEFPLPDGGADIGPFGFALSPDGRTVAAGWVGGPVHILGPTPATLREIGAPLVVADDGHLVAVTGRAGEAYLVEGDVLVDLAPADSDPVAMPGTGTLAWPSVGQDGDLTGVEVRDLLAGTRETYVASGLATNVSELRPGHVLLEATAFDPLARTVGIVDRRDGRFATFEASAPAD